MLSREGMPASAHVNGSAVCLCRPFGALPITCCLDTVARRQLAGTAGPSTAVSAVDEGERVSELGSEVHNSGSSRRMAATQLVVGSAKILQRTWPFVFAATAVFVVATMIMAFVLIVLIGAIGNSVMSAAMSDMMSGGGDVMTTLMLVYLAGTFLLCVLCGIADAPWIGLVAVATDAAIRSGERPNAADVLTLIRGRIVPLAGTFVVIVVVAIFVPTAITTVLPPAAMAGAGGYLVFIVAASLTIGALVLLDLAPWAVLFEGRGVITALSRGVALAKPAFPQLLALHLIWVVTGAPLIVLAMELPSVVGVVAMFITAVLIACCYTTCQGLVYADIRAVESGHSLDLRFDTPPVPLNQGWAEIRAAIAR